MFKQMLFKYQGQIGAALVLGGVDVTGPHLFTIAPHGSSDKLPYVTMGSGSLAAMAVFESQWKKDMDVSAHFCSKPPFMLSYLLLTTHDRDKKPSSSYQQLFPPVYSTTSVQVPTWMYA